ncbi:hypothetical protein [Micropruina sonneratiae]|uniref:hypothetical protein n=1 Tax=Micropruina sonneratiae TaxID=2986940 RepID=UPI002227E349|nr:hypothetical protein [Micropruina sp. KQZ13P-5]MCW3159461.1 hypothetical protein [Micropruina sp. KQZ13P-5]
MSHDQQPEPTQGRLSDLPLIREELLTEIEQRHRDVVPAFELADMRWHYQQVIRHDDART